MNRHVNFCKSAMAAWLSAAFMMVLPVAAAPPPPPPAPPVAKPAALEVVVVRSVFVLPANPKEGRDPFFPNSSRPYEEITSKNPVASDITSLVLRGISGPPDHRLAIINNHSFGTGDEGDVITPHGRIHIRCVEIKDASVVVEAGGQHHELIYTSSH
jgi:hypothetical protein